MNRILVALDGSPRAIQVLATAADLARRTGAKLRAFRAVGIPPEVPMSVFGLSPDGFMELLLKNAKKELDDVVTNVPDGFLEGVEVRIGTAWSAICEAAKEDNVDLIVIGSHGYGGLDRLIGTTAAKVVNHADCSVLVARPERSSA